MTHSNLPIILATDFGAGSLYVGVMHGVLAVHAPAARILDLCHDIMRHDVMAGALCLETSIDYFPCPSVYCCVVDPGVGTARRAIAAWDRQRYYVAPDNGILTLIERIAEEQRRSLVVREIDLGSLPGRGAVGATFHGRDVFAPVAAWLSRGGAGAFETLGPLMEAPARLIIPTPRSSPDGRELIIHVMATDPFGNVITSLRHRDWESVWKSSPGVGAPEKTETPPRPEDVEIHIGSISWRGIVATYGDVGIGQPLAYWGSGGRLEIALREGHAANRFSIVRNAPIRLNRVVV